MAAPAPAPAWCDAVASRMGLVSRSRSATSLASHSAFLRTSAMRRSSERSTAISTLPNR